MVYGLFRHGGVVAKPTAFKGEIHPFSMAAINDGSNHRSYHHLKHTEVF